jgi:16S rRNA (cytidine1402-2'-O)-methyltransferase
MIGGDESPSRSKFRRSPDFQVIRRFYPSEKGLGSPGAFVNFRSSFDIDHFSFDKSSSMPGTLYLVATPIGNLADITHRAVDILRNVSLIACEDTRHTRKLLQHYGLSTKTISYHEHNEQQRAQELVQKLNEGEDVAVVSDAGTPSISDPGFRIVRAAIENDVAVVPVPGPSALISALVAAGLPTDEFFFGGFLPAKSNARRARFTELRSVPGTLVFYEAPHRLSETLNDALETLGEREAVVARELTKLHEEIKRGRLSELAKHYESEEPRGEIVLLIDRNALEEVTANESVADLVDQFERDGLDHRAALKKAARELRLSRAEAYRRLQTERGRD